MVSGFRQSMYTLYNDIEFVWLGRYSDTIKGKFLNPDVHWLKSNLNLASSSTSKLLSQSLMRWLAIIVEA